MYIVTPPPTRPCEPSPCGPYSICREINNHGVCSCQPGYIGIPPMCRPECQTSAECDLNKACVGQKCLDPCTDDKCAANARCNVVSHNPICSCKESYTGDPFVNCIPIESKHVNFFFYTGEGIY